MPNVATNGSQGELRDRAIAHIEHLHEIADTHRRAHERIAGLARAVTSSAACDGYRCVVDQAVLDELDGYLRDS